MSDPTPRLADGFEPWTPDRLLERLRQLDIDAVTHAHPPVFTVEQAQALKGDLPGAHTKNLFLRDKGGRMWLVTALHDREIDLRALAPRLGARGRLSFGSPSRLMRHLGVTPGSVTPFAVVNDPQGEVRVVLDTGLRHHTLWNAHPLDNTHTTALAGEDLVRFLHAHTHPPTWIDL